MGEKEGMRYFSDLFVGYLTTLFQFSHYNERGARSQLVSRQEFGRAVFGIL
jgi:hypothetical protein